MEESILPLLLGLITFGAFFVMGTLPLLPYIIAFALDVLPNKLLYFFSSLALAVGGLYILGAQKYRLGIVDRDGSAL